MFLNLLYKNKYLFVLLGKSTSNTNTAMVIAPF